MPQDTDSAPGNESSGSTDQKTFLKRMERIHGVLLLVWVLLMPPTILLWKNSIVYLVFISVYTIIAEHAIGFLTARAQLKGEQEK